MAGRRERRGRGVNKGPVDPESGRLRRRPAGMANCGGAVAVSVPTVRPPVPTDRFEQFRPMQRDCGRPLATDGPDRDPAPGCRSPECREERPPPRNLGRLVNSETSDHRSLPSADGNSLHITSNREGGCGLEDICVTKRSAAGEWGPARERGSPRQHRDERPLSGVLPRIHAHLLGHGTHRRIGGEGPLVDRDGEPPRRLMTRPALRGGVRGHARFSGLLASLGSPVAPLPCWTG